MAGRLWNDYEVSNLFRSTLLRFTTIVKIRHCTTDSSYAVERKMNIIRTVLSLTTLNSTVLKELKMTTIPYENKY